MNRTIESLAEWLFREDEFPDGVIALTGTGIIPPPEFTLAVGDLVEIRIDGIGVLRNVVETKDEKAAAA
jgi:2-dehydro-3-deoxy-D-arabinonate dehydratase